MFTVERLMVFDFLLLLAKYKEFSGCCLQGVLARCPAACNLVRVWPEYDFTIVCQVFKIIFADR